MSMTRGILYDAGGAPFGLPLTVSRGGRRPYVVDGAGGDGNPGHTFAKPFETIGKAIDSADEGQVIFIMPNAAAQTDTDPTSYEETIIIETPGIKLIGVPMGGGTQGALPQLKIGADSTAMIDIQAPMVGIYNLGINGGDSTGGGIVLTDDGGDTYSVWGYEIAGCHFKNCKCHATHGSAGGAIYWSANGGAWQGHIHHNHFYKNVADIVMIGTGESIPQDILIDWNIFSGPAADVDGNIYTGGDGINGLIIDHNVFACWPALSSGDIAMPVKLTNSVGVLSWNAFGCTGKTFGAAANATVPTTMMICGNYQDGALIART